MQNDMFCFRLLRLVFVIAENNARALLILVLIKGNRVQKVPSSDSRQRGTNS